MKTKKGLYCRETRGIPSFYTPLKDLEKFVTIYFKWNKWVPLAREELRRIYEEEQGMTKLQAAQLATEQFNTFWRACINLVEKGTYPFVLVLKDLDVSRIKDNFNSKEESNDWEWSTEESIQQS